MQQVKLFKGVETGVDDLERDINTWISESGAKVITITGNIAPQTVERMQALTDASRIFGPSDLFVVVLYEQE